MAGPTLTARLYSLLFRRTSTFALTIAVGALFFERAFDQGADAIYEHINEGTAVCPLRPDVTLKKLNEVNRSHFAGVKLWKHIKHKYENKE